MKLPPNLLAGSLTLLKKAALTELLPAEPRDQGGDGETGLIVDAHLPRQLAVDGGGCRLQVHNCGSREPELRVFSAVYACVIAQIINNHHRLSRQ